jgi:hypothetical protein
MLLICFRQYLVPAARLEVDSLFHPERAAIHHVVAVTQFLLSHRMRVRAAMVRSRQS